MAAAFAAVPRHLFTPGESLKVAYAVDLAPIVKCGDNGLTISSVSAPHLQATMLEAADIKPGMRVCEVGSGGYNAALLAELVGDGGHVTTVDIDPEIVKRARTFLNEAGYDRVNVMLADAEEGVPDLSVRPDHRHGWKLGHPARTTSSPTMAGSSSRSG